MFGNYGPPKKCEEAEIINPHFLERYFIFITYEECLDWQFNGYIVHPDSITGKIRAYKDPDYVFEMKKELEASGRYIVICATKKQLKWQGFVTCKDAANGNFEQMECTKDAMIPSPFYAEMSSDFKRPEFTEQTIEHTATARQRIQSDITCTKVFTVFSLLSKKILSIAS